MGMQTEWGPRGGEARGGAGRGSHEGGGWSSTWGRTDGRTDGQVGECGGSSPQAQSRALKHSPRGLAEPGRRDTAGQHRWLEHLSEDTNKVKMMVKAMGHRASMNTRDDRREMRRWTGLAGGGVGC